MHLEDTDGCTCAPRENPKRQSLVCPHGSLENSLCVRLSRTRNGFPSEAERAPDRRLEMLYDMTFAHIRQVTRVSQDRVAAETVVSPNSNSFLERVIFLQQARTRRSS